jgi:hypothetical protein
MNWLSYLRPLTTAAVFLSFSCALPADDKTVAYEGTEGPGQGKQIVLISGDEEYRSEEALPMLAQILAKHHGFNCTVLFSLDENGVIDPNNEANVTGLEALESADLMIIFTRFRKPAQGMQYVDAYIKAGKPVIGLRTATHAFAGLTGEYARYNNGYDGENWKGGFGREVLGEMWINHHGHHGQESTRGIIVEQAKKHPIVQGIQPGEIWGTTDVYGVRLPLPGDSQTLVLGQVLRGMHQDDEPVDGPKNQPMMPIAWTKTYQGANGATGRVFTTTMGASQDFVAPGLRRLVINAVYWTLGMESQIDTNRSIEFVSPFSPTAFGFKNEPGYWQKIGRRPEDFRPAAVQP